MNLLFLPGSYTSPAARFRVLQFVNPLRNAGHRVDVKVISPEREWSPTSNSARLNYLYTRVGSIKRLFSAIEIIRTSDHYDIIFMNRDLIPELRITWLEPMLKRHNPRMIFDFDDAIFIGKREQKLRKILPYFAWLTPGNLYLAEFAKKINSKISIWPTVIDTNRYYPVYKKRSEQIRIGWSGSKGNLRYLSIIERPIREMAKQVNIEFVVISDINPNLDWDNVQIRYIPWSEFSEVNDLQEIDIGLMPLHDGPFERGKCGFKAISYMGIGIPALVSPVGVNKEIVIHGETGFHCKNDEEWTHYLKLLMKDSGLRYLMGKRARTRIEELYSVNFLLPYMVEIFKLLAS